MTMSELASMVGGRVLQGGEIVVESVIIDSREVKPDSVFFAIVGERLDGHQFVPQALETARAAVVSHIPEPLPPGKAVVEVSDTTVALQQLARAVRERHDFLLIGITGSAGKTTTKEMIATLIATERRTFKSWGNFNNLVGCPLCIDNTPDDAEIVVSEMGMNHKGEIAQLAGLTHPDVGVYTNIGPVHIEFFGTVEKIAEAKRELLENVKPGGIIVINADNEHVVRISKGFDGRKVTYGIDRAAEYRATSVREHGLLGTSFTVEAEGEKRQFDLSLPGRHNLENLLAAIATARAVGISWDGVKRGIGQVKPANHRGVVSQFRGATVYDDTYNSNPYAVARALELLRQASVEERRIAVLGDMLELGERELQYHHDAGIRIPRAVDVVVGVGRRAQSLLEGAREAGFSNGRLHHFDTAEDAGRFLVDFVRPGDLVLLKASRGVGLEKAVAMLKEKQ
jgi:UDP-N-acetylmuramoyl-tripeptide--D-alanyl-D-alanine ligase